jgi:lysozyme
MPLVVDLYQRYQTVTNWAALAGAVGGAYIKYTDGLASASTTPDGYVAGCKKWGIPYGGYHFAEPGDAVRQADVFVAAYRRYGGDLAPALDLEASGIPAQQRSSFARTFINRVRESYPKAALYASTSWLAGLSPGLADLIWAAEYGNNDGTRHAITHFPGVVHMHQYTSNGRVAGISGLVDLDWTDDLSQFRLSGNSVAATGTALADYYTEDSIMRIPSGGVKDVGTSYTLPVSPLREHDLVIAPGAVPVVLYAVFNWTMSEGTGTGGNPVTDPKNPIVVGTQMGGSWIIPKGTTKVDIIYWSDSDFSAGVFPR